MKCENVISFYAKSKRVKVFQLLLNKWTILKELVCVLKIPYDATVFFQRKTLTLSDVYGRWITSLLHLRDCAKRKSYTTGLADCLVNALNQRKEVVFKNPSMVCALYLDPRFHTVVASDENLREQSKKQLLNIWRRLHVLQIETSEQNDTSNNSNELQFEFDEQAAWDLHMSASAGSSTLLDPVSGDLNPCNEPDIEILIDIFQPKTLPINTDVLRHWESIKCDHPELHELAMVVFSVPPTEVRVECDFSSLDFIFTKRRCRLTEQRLTDILLIYLNKDLFYESTRLSCKIFIMSIIQKKNYSQAHR